jgi:hypothetical protein
MRWSATGKNGAFKHVESASALLAIITASEAMRTRTQTPYLSISIRQPLGFAR